MTHFRTYRGEPIPDYLPRRYGPYPTLEGMQGAAAILAGCVVAAQVLVWLAKALGVG